eukprot:CAMPEP_0184683814 /NCGR_PEP_ID=MMETSP0312-20130426/12696_1 /TAXON_ID=31354 /ORGANISM="Compsopogon coeruleus, Strain SAG 36.94" /LENGTH=46 /DNA_ID= /DNA_START= /DNA_END= /DNA_ORIENTATION=
MEYTGAKFHIEDIDGNRYVERMAYLIKYHSSIEMGRDEVTEFKMLM